MLRNRPEGPGCQIAWFIQPAATNCRPSRSPADQIPPSCQCPCPVMPSGSKGSRSSSRSRSSSVSLMVRQLSAQHRAGQRRSLRQPPTPSAVLPSRAHRETGPVPGAPAAVRSHAPLIRTAISSVFAVRVNPLPSIATPPRPAAAIRRSRSVRIASPPFGVPGLAAQVPPGPHMAAHRPHQRYQRSVPRSIIAWSVSSPVSLRVPSRSRFRVGPSDQPTPARQVLPPPSASKRPT